MPSPAHAFTIWLTGLSGAGKTTLGRRLVSHLTDQEWRARLLDGDDLRRQAAARELGFSKDDRDRHIARVGQLALRLNSEGVIAVVATISPYRRARDENRRLIGRFVEVFLNCPLATLIERDAKGLYRLALSGEIDNFTGVSAVYEPPLAPELVIRGFDQRPEESCATVLRTCRALGYLPPE